MKEEYKKWYSPTLGKDMEMLVYGHFGTPLVIFPTTMGRYYESRDFKLVESARQLVEEGKVKIYCPDTINDLSWYNKSIHPADRVKNHIVFERFIKDEVIDAIRHEYGLNKIAVGGASFGGYSAANFAFKNPHLISHLISMSGSFDIRSFMDGYYDENVYFNNPVDFLRNSNHPELWNLNITLGYGEWDICKDANLQLSTILSSKNIPHWLDERRWAKHDWPLWRMMFPDYLSKL